MFYMIWREGGAVPLYQHSSERSARAEAERLSRLQPGARFYILVSVDSVILPLQPVEWERRDRGAIAGTDDLSKQPKHFGGEQSFEPALKRDPGAPIRIHDADTLKSQETEKTRPEMPF